MSLITSNELTERYNISYQTLNFYTNLGLLNVKKRVRNKRYYDDEEVRPRMNKIIQLKEDGYPLRIIIKRLNGGLESEAERAGP